MLLLFNDNARNNWLKSVGTGWLSEFNRGKKSTTNNLANLIGRSHFWDLSFLHGMASARGESPHDTLAKVLMWAEVMYRLSVGDGVAPADRLSDIAISSGVASGTQTFSYRMSSYFTNATQPTGGATIAFLLARGTAYTSRTSTAIEARTRISTSSSTMPTRRG